MATCIIVPWFNYWRTKNEEEFGLLKRSLEHEKHKVYLFDLEERPDNLEDALERLHKLIKETKAKKLSLIGFSLGSFISLKYIEKYGSSNIDKTILCIPLIGGSKSFRTIYKIKPTWKKETGKVLHQASYEKLNPEKVPNEVKVGVIRGTKKMGWNRFISYLSQAVHPTKKNDGLFSTDETDFGKYDILSLKVNHYNAPKNKSLIKAVKHFVKESKF